MFLLYFLIALFLVVISLIVYANWPASSSGNSCGDCGNCSTCPCRRCGMPKPRCNCRPKNNECQFC